MTENVCLDNPFIWLDKTEHGPRLHIMNGGKAFNTREYIVDSYDPRDPPEALQRFMTVAHEYGIARLVRHALGELEVKKGAEAMRVGVFIERPLVGIDVKIPCVYITNGAWQLTNYTPSNCIYNPSIHEQLEMFLASAEEYDLAKEAQEALKMIGIEPR